MPNLYLVNSRHLLIDSLSWRVDSLEVPAAAPDPGSAIVAGTFSRGQWRNLKRDLETEREVRARTERLRKEAEEAAAEAERQARIAEISRQVAERRAADEAKLREELAALQAKFAPPGAAASDLKMAVAEAALRTRQAQAKAEALAKAAELEEEEAAAAALLLM